VETLRVLVVDDEPGMRSGVERALRDYSVRLPELDEEIRFHVEQAGSGEQAIQMLAETKTDLMLLDHKLPGMSGLDVLERIGARDSTILTIMITAYASLETAVTATKRGAYDFLAKPFTPAELKSAIQKAAKHLVLQQQARRLAEEKRQVRFQFISVLSHELKAPLAAIEGYLSIVKEKSAGDDAAVYDHMIDRCLLRLEGMRKLIFDLLDLTRIESGQKRRELVEVDLRELAGVAIETAGPEAARRAITVLFAPGPPVVMNGDRSELEIVLNNLLSNAVKYNRDGGSVTIEIDQDDQAVALRVADTGIGMTEEEAAKLFGDFVRIKNVKTRAILGSGLGLSTVRKLARLYGGDVSVTSRPDVGSTFTVTLKKHPDPGIVHADQTGHPELAAGR
jgi:signal transduction histidine kinase